MNIFSACSGIGGFELGIQNAYQNTNIKPVFIGHSEIDKYAEQVYQKHFGGKNYGDTTNNESSKNFFKVTVYHDIAQKFAPELYEGSYVVLSGFLLDNIVYARHLRQYSLIPEDYAYDWENDGFK